MYRVSIDVGGTFTDLVAIEENTGKIVNINLQLVYDHDCSTYRLYPKLFLTGETHK